MNKLAALLQQSERKMIRSSLKSSRKVVVTNLMNPADTLDIPTMKTVTRTRVRIELSTTYQENKRISTKRKLSALKTLQGLLVRWKKIPVAQWTMTI